jgi:tripartite-type tricarboxylate transporter receptor subunit TctC
MIVRTSLCALLTVAAGFASAQDYPNRPMRVVVPNAPGSSIDTMSRILAQKMGETMGQTLVVENRDGAAGLIGMEVVKNSKPDGYLLASASNGSMVIAPAMKKSPPYDPLNDYSLVSLFAVNPNVLVVTPSLPVNNLRELIAYAKANPGKLNMSSAGVGSQSHLSGVLLMTMAGFDALHVPHKGGGPSVAAVVAGQTHWTTGPAPAVMGQVNSGKLRALGHTSEGKSSLLPDLPSLAESVPGYTFSGWAGLVSPRGLPQPIVERLRGALAKTVAQPDVRQLFAKQGAEVLSGSPEDFRRFLQQEVGNTARVLKAAQIEAE